MDTIDLAYVYTNVNTIMIIIIVALTTLGTYNGQYYNNIMLQTTVCAQ